MIGVFDSGVGGLAAYSELRRMLPREDIIYLADRENAPYGTKSKDVLTELVTTDAERLLQLGARKILIACCTASTVHARLPEHLQRVSVPIISYAADAVFTDRVCIIATTATVCSHAFREEILLRNPDAHVTEIATQELVTLVEHPEHCTVAERRSLLDHVAARIAACAPSELILGCTHFSHIRDELAYRLPSVRIIDTARIAARRMAEDIINEEINAPPAADTRGRGRSIYT